MSQNLLQKSIILLFKRQTNILSAAFIIMITVVLSQILGIFRDRLLVSIFEASDKLGIYKFALLLPETIFQLTIAAALSSAFIPVFSEYINKGKEEEAHKMSSTLLITGLVIFGIISFVLSLFAPFFLQMFNAGGQFRPDQMILMTNLMRLIIIGQFIFIIGSFLTALLQSYNHFFIPGIAGALYNLGMIIGIYFLSPMLDIYAAPVGILIGSCIFVLVQIPVLKKVRFSFRPARAFLWSQSTQKILKLMWPRAISIIIFQLGTLALASLISYLMNPGRMFVIFDYAKTLANAPVVLIGMSISQAAFPVLAREKDNLPHFKATFLTSFNQMLYLILPVSALILVLRIPIVRLIYGAERFDWGATVLTGRTLAFFAISIAAAALITLVYRAFYALHNTVVPLIVGTIATVAMITISGTFIYIYNSGLQQLAYPYSFFNTFHGEFVLSFGVEGLALAFSIGQIVQLLILLSILSKKVGNFQDAHFYTSLFKIFFASFLTALALYIPLKLLDQLVFDTSHTTELIILTGISSTIGLTLYLFLTWLFDVQEAKQYLLIFKKAGNWREILGISGEVIDANRSNP